MTRHVKQYKALIAGVDEAGRGPLAGPVYAAAVVLDPARPIEDLQDSKLLSAAQRDRLDVRIRECALAYSICSANVEEIDRINILQATMLAMRRAVDALTIQPSEVLVDGNRCPHLAVRARAIVKGDQRVQAISAASILAKVTRDRVMTRLGQKYPEYGFAQHKGYATFAHRRALREHGPCPEHRRSFAPVRDALAPELELNTSSLES